MSNEADRLLRAAFQAQSEGRLAEARRGLAEAVDLLRREGARAELGQALRNLGELERRLPDGEAAQRHYEEAVALFREVDEPLKLAHTVRHLGDVYSEAGRAELARPCYDEALAIYRSHEETPPLDLANAIRSLAVLMGEAGDAEEARRLWQEARDLYTAVDVPAGVAESTARLARHPSGDTPMKASLRSVTPLIPSGGSLAAELAFYTEHMGFSIVWQGGSMAGIERDDIAFHLVENDNKAWAENASFSIGVSDLEALYQEYRQIPAMVGPLETKSWGRREFHMIVPSGVCLQFYQQDDA